MNEKAINSLNKTLTIHFPIDELGVYMHGSELDDKAVPVLAKAYPYWDLHCPRFLQKSFLEAAGQCPVMLPMRL